MNLHSLVMGGCTRCRRALRQLNVPLNVVVVLAQTVAAYFLDSGVDFALFREATLDADPEVWLPAYGYWLLYPFMLLPRRLSFGLIVLVSTSLIAYAGHRLTGSGLPALFSSAAFLAAETGQIDGFVVLGIALGVLACERQAPHLLGVGLLLMSLKPQIGLVAAVWMLIYMRDWRTLLIPTVVFLFSLLVEGMWPMELFRSPPQLALAPQNVSLWRVWGPYALPLLALPFILGGDRPRRAVVLAVAASVLTMPCYNLYSLHATFAVGISPGLVPLTYLPFLPWPSSWEAWRVLAMAVVPALGIFLLLRKDLQTLLSRGLPRRWKAPVILLITFLTRMVHIQGRALWYDEAFAVLYSSLNPRRMVYGTVMPAQGAGAADVHPLLYYFLLHGWMEVAGRSPLAVRFLSVILGMLTVAVLWRLASWCLGSRAGLAVGLLAAVNPFHVAYSQEARMYALLSLGAILAAWGLLRALKESRLRWWAMYAGAATVTLYVHNLGAFVLLALHFLVAFRSRWRRHLPQLALADLLALLLFSPWLVMVLPGQIDFVERGYWLPSPNLDEVVRAVMLPVLTFYEPAPLWLLGIGLLTGLLLLVLLVLQVWRSQSPVGGFLLLSWIPIVSLLLISCWRPLYLERALLPSALFYLVAVGWLLTHEALPRIVRLGLVVLLAASSLGSLSIHYTYAGFPRPPFQEATAHLRANVQVDDAIVHTNKLTYLPMHYYGPDVSGVFLADPFGSPQDTLARPTQEALGLFATSTITAAVGEANRVWLVMFPREMEELEALGASSSAQDWLENRFVKYGERRFEALSLTLYKEGHR